MNCEEARSEMAAAALDQADPASGRSLEAHVAGCAACGAEYAAVGLSISLARSAGNTGFELPSALKDRVMSAATVADLACGRGTFVERARLLGTVAALAVCAGLILAATLFTIFGGPGGGRSSAMMVFGGATLMHESGNAGSHQVGLLGACPRTILLPARLRVTAPTRFDLPGGVSVACQDASLRLDRSGVVLDDGAVSVSVSPGTPFRIETQGARIEVTGTVFHVEAAGGKTAVSVDRGSVRLYTGSASVELKPGQSAAAAAGAVSSERFTPDPALCALALSRDLHLEARLDRSSNPPSIELTLHNISSTPVVVPVQGADRPRFSLKFRSAATGFEGVARLPESTRVAPGSQGGSEPAASPAGFRLEPSEAMRLRFEISSILSEQGEYQVWGVYQSTPPVLQGAWTGQAVSGPLEIVIGPR